MINSVYGKTIENLRKTINVRLVNNEINFKNFAAIKPVLTLNKPIYVGFTVLELSKWFMYDFQCNFIKKKLMLIYYLLIQTVLLMKSNQKIFMNNFLNTNTCLTIVNITQIFLIQLTKTLLPK